MAVSQLEFPPNQRLGRPLICEPKSALRPILLINYLEGPKTQDGFAHKALGVTIIPFYGLADSNVTARPFSRDFFNSIPRIAEQFQGGH